MPCDYHRLPHEGIQTLHPYVPGKPIEELAREEKLTHIIKMASNENPLGCSPTVRNALAGLSATQIASYPSPANHRLRPILSKKLNIPEDMLILGNGSDLLFSLILTTFALHTGKTMLTHEKAFLTYQIQAQSLGIPWMQTPLKENWQVDIDELIHASHRYQVLIFLANPNNPTGVVISLQEIKRLLANVPPLTLVVLDEAYYEYAFPLGDDSSLKLLQDNSNLIITRTFSKAYGLAGLRLGYAIAHPEITELLLRVQLPFTINQAALEAATAALGDEAFLKQSLTINQKGMQQLQTGLNALNLSTLPSHCNFLTFDCQTDALPIYNRLLKQGIIVRPLHAYHLPKHLRVTIGKPLENKEFLDKLNLCLSQPMKR